MKTSRILLALTLSLFAFSAKAASKITSPDGHISVEVNTTTGHLGYTVSRDGRVVYSFRDIALSLNKTSFPVGKIKVGKTVHVKNSFKPAVPLKFSTVNEDYKEATISIGSGASFLLRVMNNGVAHRFVLAQKGDVEVYDEPFRFVPAEGFKAHRQTAPNNFNTSFEEAYRHETLAEWNASDRKMTTLPLLLSADDDTQLLVGQSDVDDYPHQFLYTDGEAIVPMYPKAPLKWEPRGDRSETITEEAKYIAKTSGRRALPWRWVAVTDSKGIIEQTLPVQLARRSVLKDESWIHPGQFSWEWWNGAAPFGPDVDFRSGCNYETYCYFADFAAKFGIDYILLDEGWAKSTRDPFHGNDNLRLPDLIKYCNAKGVKIVLWLPWLTVEQNFDQLFKTYAEWGIPAVKIDFMDHADQWMVNFFKRVVQEAAKYKIIVDFHGAFTPAGLEYEYPNLVSYEGVRGLEQMSGCRPENTTYIPFIRNAVGAADFTPGGMNNMQPDQYRASRPNSGAMGTRCFQMALYVVLESGVQMLADNPTRYYQNEDCTRYIASVPTTWDETRALEAKAGEYVVVAKRKGSKWFVGGITNGEERDFRLKLDFLGAGQHKLTAFKDGLNAGYQAMHYNKLERDVNNSTEIDVHMAKNGGWAAVIE
ncbi:MAG: glycoside hydrolase family 97 catalytic domain-containing protein [Bacteroidaceae bacterium]|nr:glycoside hydrolase family 97 catalytic domain-containing protein [Bacteroidaceae bacterium]